MILPNFSLENKFINSGVNFIAGTDEVGRGAWAGPVTAAAVILDPKKIPNGINDSKKLTKNKRNQLSAEIIAMSISCSIIHISVVEIDIINIIDSIML